MTEKKQLKVKSLSNNFHFMQDFLNHTTMVPDLLLQCYGEMGLNEEELVLFLQVLCKVKNASVFSVQQLQEELPDTQAILELLCNKGLLTEEGDYGAGFYSLQGFLYQLWEIWCYKKSCSQKKLTTTFVKKTTNNTCAGQDFATVYQLFEQELARPLSPIEVEKITKWSEEDSFSQELIKEALTRAVLQGKTSLNYIDRILLSWKKQNLRTVAEVLKNDDYGFKHKNNKKQPTAKSEPKSVAKSEYDLVYEKALRP